MVTVNAMNENSLKTDISCDVRTGSNGWGTHAQVLQEKLTQCNSSVRKCHI